MTPPFSGLRLLVSLLTIILLLMPAISHGSTVMGANKFDLLQQYEGFASGGDGSSVAVEVRQALARKAIQDAQAAGFAFFRVSVSGFFPVEPKTPVRDALLLWQVNPAAYWQSVDMMMDDLDKSNIRLIPTLIWEYRQFPALAGETTSEFFTNPNSKSRQLASRFVREFVHRYHDRRTILFWELTNEFNLSADLDLTQRCSKEKSVDPLHCASVGNFSTADLDEFSHEMVVLIHQEDPHGKISSGYALPRSCAFHLERQPEWSPKGPDWTADAYSEFEAYLKKTQSDFDLVSVHIYSSKEKYLGRAPEMGAEMAIDATQVAHALGKQIFIGEFGDERATPFFVRMSQILSGNDIDYAAVWAWEFYRFDLHQEDSYSLDLSPDDERLQLLPIHPQR